MADSSPNSQFAARTSNALRQEVRVVNNRGLDTYKDEIIALTRRSGFQMKGLPQLVERELGIKAKPKAYRIALERWGQKKNVPTEHSMFMVGIQRKWARHGRHVEFRLSGNPYSSERLKRFITYQQDKHNRPKTFWDELTTYSAKDVPQEIYYFDPKDPGADLMALDGSSQQIVHHQSETNSMKSDHAFVSKDPMFETSQEIVLHTSLRSFDAHCPISPDACLVSSPDVVTVKELNRVNTVELKSIWQWVSVARESLGYTYTTNITTPYCERAIVLYRQHFGNTPYDASEMDDLVEQLLADDRLQEAEEIAVLAVELSDSLVGNDHMESWKAKGNLARVYCDQGRYPIAHQLGESTVEFFKRNRADRDASALIFNMNLAQTLLRLGKWSEAKRLCYNVCESAHQEFKDENNIISLTARLHLAQACNAQNERQEAREILETVTKARPQGQEFATEKILQAYIELAKVLQKLGLTSEALNIQCRLEKELDRLGAPRSMWTLDLISSVGEQLYYTGDYVGSEYVFRNLVQCTATRTKFGNHTKVVFAKCWVAKSLCCQGKGREAATIHLECLNVLKESLGPSNRHTLACMFNFAWARRHQDRKLKFEAKMVEIRDLRKYILGENDPDTLGSEIVCSDIALRGGRWGDALNLLGEVRARLRELPESGRLHAEWRLLKSETEYFTARGDAKAAVEKMQYRLALGKRIFGKDHPLALKGLQDLARSYSMMGQKNKATSLLSEGILNLGGVLGIHHPAVTWLKGRHAAELSSQGHWVTAEMHQRQVLHEHTTLGEQHPYVIKARRRLARICRELGKFPDAEDLLKGVLKASNATFGPKHEETRFVLKEICRVWSRNLPYTTIKRKRRLNTEKERNKFEIGKIYVVIGGHRSLPLMISTFLPEGPPQNGNIAVLDTTQSLHPDTMTATTNLGRTPSYLREAWEAFGLRFCDLGTHSLG